MSLRERPASSLAWRTFLRAIGPQTGDEAKNCRIEPQRLADVVLLAGGLGLPFKY